MKEILKKIFIAVVAVVVVIGGVAYMLKGDEPVDTGTSSTSQTAGTATPQQDTTAGVQTSDSVNADATTNNTSDVTTNAGSSQYTTGAKAPQVQQTTTAPQGNSATENVQGTTGYQPNTPGTTAAQNQQPVTQSQQNQQSPQPQQGNTVTSAPAQNSTAPQRKYKVDAYQEIFKSGRFLMKIKDPELGSVIMAMSGNKMLVEASMEGVTMKMLYDGDKTDKDNPNGTWYIIIDKIKKYSPISADLVGDMNVKELTKEFANSSDDTDYKTSTETVNGEVLYCESCVDANGNTTKYYFKGDQLVRSDSISPSGAVSTTEFQEVSGNVDDSFFAIPDGYAKWDISWLIDMIG